MQNHALSRRHFVAPAWLWLCASLFFPAALSVAPDALAAAPDVLRAGTGSGDHDGDGIIDEVDVDDDNDTIADDKEGELDRDLDGIPDCYDLDSDNDGITDLIESTTDRTRLALLDADGDGRLDAGVALGANGLADLVELFPDAGQSVNGFVDTDGDGLRDQLDLDSDNDGLADVIEAGSVDGDRDGHLDRFRDLDADGLHDQLAVLPIAVRDTDGDGTQDFRDLDSDNDGLTDLLESTGIDTDGNGQVDVPQDANQDGLDDSYAALGALPDSDADGIPDIRDASDDASGGGGSDGGDGATDGNGGQGDGLVLDTGTEGSALAGCSLAGGTGSTRDPLLPLLALAALLVLARSNRARGLRSAGTVASLVLVLPVVSVPGTARAAVDDVYIGIGAGASRLDIDTGDSGLVTDSRGDFAAQFLAGLDLHPNWRLETRLADLGEVSFTDGRAVGYQVADIGVIGTWWWQSVGVFARLGLGRLANDGDIDTRLVNTVHVATAAGIEWRASPAWHLRAELSGHDVDAMHAEASITWYPWRQRSASLATIATVERERGPASASGQSLDASNANDASATTDASAATDGPGAGSSPTTDTAAADRDRDGVSDDEDRCDDTPAAAVVTPSGCELFNTPVDGLDFTPGSADFLDTAYPVLDTLRDVLARIPSLQLVVEAHVDGNGDERLAALLARRRALAIVRHLAGEGIDPRRLTPRGIVAPDGTASDSATSDATPGDVIVLRLRDA